MYLDSSTDDRVRQVVERLIGVIHDASYRPRPLASLASWRFPHDLVFELILAVTA